MIQKTLILTTLFCSMTYSFFGLAEGPKFVPDNPIQLKHAIAGERYELDLTTMLVSQGSGNLDFFVDSAPAWLKVEPPKSKNLIGTPPAGINETFTLKLTVKEKPPGELGDTLRPTTLRVYAKPQFVSDPIELGNQSEDSSFSLSLDSLITDPKAGPFNYTALGTPSWMTLQNSTLSGTPPWTVNHVHAGNYSIKITAMGPGGTTTVSARGLVTKTYRNPHWISTPNPLPNAFEGKPYSEKIGPFAAHEEVGPLTFVAVTAPNWITVSKRDGTISGTPNQSHVGAVSVTVSLAQTVDGQILNGGNSVFTFEVIDVLHPPVWIHDPLDLGLQKEDQPFSFNLKPHVNDPGGNVLTFTALGLPSWMKLDNGILSGTPPWSKEHALVGPYNGITLTVATPDGSALAKAFGNVSKTIKPPVWDGNPITISDALEDSNYEVDIKNHVINFEETPLRFTAVNPPVWLQLTGLGSFVGQPGKGDVGSVSVIARAKTTIDGTVYDTGPATFKFAVIHVNHAPIWTSPIIDLPAAWTKKPYSQSVAGSASDPDGDKLTFSLGAGAPAWIQIASNGTISGIPSALDLGLNTFSIIASDPSNASATTLVRVNVNKTIEPCTWNKPVVLKQANEDAPYTEDLVKYISNPDNLVPSFSLIAGNGWSSVSGAGIVSGTPTTAHLGVHKLSLRVTCPNQPPDTADALLEVIHTNHAPVWVLNPIQVIATEDQPLQKDISGYALDKDIPLGDKLTFGIISSPSGGSNWLTISNSGTLSGTPGGLDIGAKQYTVRVADTAGLSADVTLIVDTKHVNHAPKWSQNPIQLTDAKEGTPYTESTSPFASDPDNDPLTFQKVSGSGADWVTVSQNGFVTGTPARKDVGLSTFKVRVTDSLGLFADVSVRINVILVKHPPYWTSNPIQMSNATEDTQYRFDLTPFGKGDGPNDALTFTKVSGPDWIVVSSQGIVTGIPQEADIGPFQVSLSLSNDVGTANTVGLALVLDKNHPPVINAAALTFGVKERDILTVDLNNPTYLVDKDHDKLSCTPQTQLSFVKLDANCALELSPKHADVRPAPYSFNFTVTDGEFAPTGTIAIQVLRSPQMPICTSASFVAKTNIPFSESLKAHCSDPDGVPLTFATTGVWPTWLSLGREGSLTGTPKSPDVGEANILFEVKNDGLSLSSKFFLKVIPGIHIDNFQIDTAGPGAKADNLWVLDNSCACDPYIKSLKQNIGTYYLALNKAGVEIHHSSVMLSTDVKIHDGMPIFDHNISDPMNFTWNTPNIVQDFLRRLNLANSVSFCCNCYNSPTWAMHRFYEQAPELSIYQNGYFNSRIPMDVMIVTPQRDHFRKWTKEIPSMSHYTASNFAEDFINFHKETSQNLRISVVAPECMDTISTEPGSGLIEGSNDPQTVAHAGTYKVLTDKTKGVYYSSHCQPQMKTILEDYAKRVIFRAQINANSGYTLTKIPIDTQTIQVHLKGKALVGNTGNTSDQWRYITGSNSIQLFWENIDQSNLQPGDKIVITYRVS